MRFAEGIRLTGERFCSGLSSHRLDFGVSKPVVRDEGVGRDEDLLAMMNEIGRLADRVVEWDGVAGVVHRCGAAGRSLVETVEELFGGK